MNQHESRIYNGLIKECELARCERDMLAEALRLMVMTANPKAGTYSTYRMEEACETARAALAILKASPVNTEHDSEEIWEIEAEEREFPK